MSRFMFVMFEGGGNVPVQLAIARRLVGRGHAVRVLSDPAVKADAIAAGCTFAPFGSAPRHNFRDRDRDLVRDWAVRDPRRQIARMAEHVLFGPAERYARDLLAELERTPADALAIDCLLFGALAGAERSGLPTAQLCHMPYTVPTPGVPPFGLGLQPARGMLGRLRDRILGGISRRMFEKLGRRPLNAARAALGLEPLASVFDQARRQGRVLVLTARSFDFASRVPLPPNVMYAGPQLDDPGWVAPWTSPWPEDAEEPLVLVTLGSTFQNQLPVTQRVIDALASLPVRGLVTTGGAVDVDELRLPANVVAVTSAPHHQVMPRVALVVTHGGHGTVMKALSHARPMLCVPLGRDQADNAARVRAAGVGLSARPSARVRTIRARILRLLADRTFLEGARRLAAEIAADVAADRAVVELEGLGAVQRPARSEALSGPDMTHAPADVAVARLEGPGGGRGDRHARSRR